VSGGGCAREEVAVEVAMEVDVMDEEEWEARVEAGDMPAVGAGDGSRRRPDGGGTGCGDVRCWDLLDGISLMGSP